GDGRAGGPLVFRLPLTGCSLPVPAVQGNPGRPPKDHVSKPWQAPAPAAPRAWEGVSALSFEQRLAELGIRLPGVPRPVAAYVPGVQAGNLVFTSGQIPFVDGRLAFQGKVGADLTVEQGKEAARACALNALAVVRDLAGSLDRVKRVVKLLVFVNSAPGFTEQPQVANGASELMLEIFGDAGRHARSAVGAGELPLNAAVEVELVVELHD